MKNSNACTQPTVYVVDDDAAALKSLSWLLEAANLSVASYRSAEQLLDAYDPALPGCLILDVRMPGMGGIELHEELRRRNCQHPVIFVTGHGDVPTCSRAYHGGAFDFIEKPVNDQAIVDLIQRAIEVDADQRAKQDGKRHVAEHQALLTPREQEVMELMIQGKSVKQIACDLGVGFPTAARHRSRVLEKMQVDNNVELVRLVLASS